MDRLLQMIHVTITGSQGHVDSQTLDKLPLPCLCVLVAVLVRWSAGQLSTHQSSEFGWSYGAFPA